MHLQSKILVNGARGQLGGEVIARALGLTIAAGVRRSSIDLPDAIIIAQNGAVDPHHLRGVDAIINCVGRVTGEHDLLSEANITHPVRLAGIAKQAGVRRFVQVSSFSVFGHAEQIDQSTNIDPATPYGHSKYAAEGQLLALQDANFSVICVRLPFMFGVRNPALMGSLIQIMRKLPFLPTGPQPAFRSMLTYSDAADALLAAAVGDQSGAVCAADPVPFTSEMLARLMREKGMNPARLVALPDFFSKAVVKMAPAVGRRLFASSLLSPDYNQLNEIVPKRGIVEEISALLIATQKRT